MIRRRQVCMNVFKLKHARGWKNHTFLWRHTYLYISFVFFGLHLTGRISSCRSFAIGVLTMLAFKHPPPTRLFSCEIWRTRGSIIVYMLPKPNLLCEKYQYQTDSKPIVKLVKRKAIVAKRSLQFHIYSVYYLITFGIFAVTIHSASEYHNRIDKSHKIFNITFLTKI